MERLDVVDEKDEVVGEADINQIYSERLRHRIVHILLFNSEGKLALQKRSQYKSFCPGYWSTPVGGHVQKGETYEQAALREFQEELGANSPLEFLFKEVYNDSQGNKKFLSTFRTNYDGQFELNPEEVESIDFFTLEEIGGMIDRGEKFHPELLFLLKKMR
jgi:isopentenyldiphosphate isomerase